MPFRISFFKTPQHKVFHYQPRYWDPQKEALEQRIAAAKSKKEQQDIEKKARYRPGSTIRGSMQQAMYESRRYPKHQGIIRWVVVLSIVVLLFAVIYFSNLIGVLFDVLK